MLLSHSIFTGSQGLDMSRSPRSWNDRFTFRPSPSPPAAHLSMSAPMTHGFFGSASTDEGIEEDTMYPLDDVIGHKRQKVMNAAKSVQSICVCFPSYEFLLCNTFLLIRASDLSRCWDIGSETQSLPIE